MPSALPGNRKIHVLVVDDCEGDRQLIEEFLNDIEDFTYEVFGVGSLRDAENALSRYSFDVVVLDYHLGDGCGLDFIRESRHTRRAPTVLLTGYRNRELDRIALEAGADDLLYKNELQPSTLERSIRYAVERFKAAELQRKSQLELEESNIQLRNAKAQIEILGANSIKLAEYLANAVGDGERLYVDHASIGQPGEWAGLTNTCRLGIWHVDPHGKTLFANAAMASILGLRETEPIDLDRSFVSYFTPRDQERAERELMIWTHGVSSSLEVELTVADGAFPKRVVICGAPLRNLDGDVEAILVSVVDITDRRRTEASMQNMVVTDPLTGALNRLAFTQYFPKLLANAERNGRLVATLYADLDGFKEINDNLGHQAGDHVLRHVSKIIRKCTRKSDLVARIGGDEFVIALSNLEHPENAGLVAGNILATLEQPLELNDKELSLHASIGISIFPIDTTDPDELLRYADQALYRRKGSSGAWLQFFRSGDRHLLGRRLRAR